MRHADSNAPNFGSTCTNRTEQDKDLRAANSRRLSNARAIDIQARRLGRGRGSSLAHRTGHVQHTADRTLMCVRIGPSLGSAVSSRPPSKPMPPRPKKGRGDELRLTCSPPSCKTSRFFQYAIAIARASCAGSASRVDIDYFPTGLQPLEIVGPALHHQPAFS